MRRFFEVIKTNIEIFWFKTRAKMFLCRWIEVGWKELELDSLARVMNEEYEKCVGKHTMYAEWITQLHEIYMQQVEEME